MTTPTPKSPLVQRFRGYMPVVVDVETAGFNPKTDALLEIACIPILINEQGKLYEGEPLHAHIEPFLGANLEQSALAFTGINPDSPFRKAIAQDEKTAIRTIFKSLKQIKSAHGCSQCILVGHNAHFDLAFVNAVIERTNSKNHSPFHSFSVLDTATLSALAYGHTVLARSCHLAGIGFDNSHAHSALYDTQKTAELFCKIFNELPMLNPAQNTPQITANHDDKNA